MSSASSPRSRRLSWPKRLLFGLVPLALLLVGVEVAARLVGQAVLCSRQEPLPAIAFPENIRRPVNRDPGADLTVLCVGDSWTFGMQMEPQQAYPGQLQSRLREKHGLAVQVHNLGMPGSSSFRTARMVRSHLSSMPADLIVLQVGANADFVNAEEGAGAGGLLAWSLRSSLRHLASYRMLVQVVARGRVMNDDRLINLEDEARGPMHFRSNQDALRRTLGANIGRIHDMALVTDAELLLVTYGVPPSVFARCSDSTHVVNEWIRDIAAARGLPLVDMGQLYIDRGIPGSMTLNAADHVPCAQLDPHPDADGYGLYAEQISAWIAEHQEDLTRSGP